MKLLRTDHFSGFMGLLEEFVSVLGEQLRTTADFLRQKIELTQNLFNQLRQNDMFNLGIPQVDGSVVPGGQGGTGGSGGSSGAFASGLFTGPRANIGGSSPNHIDTKFKANLSWEEIDKYFLQMAQAYAEQGRRIEFSNSAVSGQVYDPNANAADRIAMLQRAAAAHAPRNGWRSFDYYIPKDGDARSESANSSSAGAEIMLPSTPGGRVNYGTAGDYGNFATLLDANGNVVMKTGHGDNRRSVPQGRSFTTQQAAPAQQQTGGTSAGTGTGGARVSDPNRPRVSGPGRVPRGGTVSQAERVQSDPAGAQALVDTARRLGLDPSEFAALMSWESAGSFNPNIRGGDRNEYKGLIQFSPSNQRQYGTGGQQSIAQQMPAVERYLIDRGFQPGQHDIRNAYAAVLVGTANETYNHPTRGRVNTFNERDSNGTTVGNAAPKFRQGAHYERGQQFLRDSGANLSGGGNFVPPPPQNSEFERFMREGYALTQRRDYQSALINFRRAAELQPNNRYAAEAIRNVTGYINRGRQSSQPNLPGAMTGGSSQQRPSGSQTHQPNLPGAMTGGSSQTVSTTSAQQPVAPQIDVNAQSQQLVQTSSQHRGQLQTLYDQQIAEINRQQEFLERQFNLDLGNIASRSQQDVVVREREREDNQRTLDRQNEDREFNRTPEHARSPEMVARQDVREATRGAEDERIAVDRQIEDLQADIVNMRRTLPETISLLRGMGAPEEHVATMEQSGLSVIATAEQQIEILKQQRENVGRFLEDTTGRITAEYQRALANTQFQNASDIANLNADLMEEQATRADQTNNPQEAARLRAGAEEVRAIRSNEELIRDLQQRMEADPTNAAQYQEQIDTAQQKIAVSLENLNETFRRTSEEIAQYNFSASNESSREVRALEIQQLRFNGDPMQALIMEQEDELNAQLDEFTKRRLEIAADVQLDGPTRAQLEADLAEIEAMTIEMSAELMIRAQVELEIANEKALLDARSTNLQALIPNLNANYEQGTARDMQAELDGLMIAQRLRETLHSIEDPSNNLTEDTRERLRLLAEETAELESQNLERDHALQIQRDQIEIARNTITNPGGPQALAQVQDEYLGMYGITPTYAMKQERLPMQLEMQNLNYQQQLLDLEELRNSGKLTQEAFEKAKVALESMNNIKLDQLKIEASGIPEIVNSVKGPMQGFFKEILDPNSTKTFGEAFSDMINGMLSNLATLAAEWVTNSLFSSFLGGGAGSPGKEGGLFSTLFGGGGEEEGAVDPALAAISGEGDPAMALAMGGQEASMNLVMGGQEAATMLIQAGVQFAQSVQSSALSAGGLGAGGLLGSGGYNWGGMAGVTKPTGWLSGMTAFSTPSVRSGGGLPGFDMNNLNFTFNRGAQTIGNSILQSSSQGANSFGGGIANALQGATRNVGGIFSGLFGGGGSMGAASGGGGFGSLLGSLLPMVMGLFGFKDGGEVPEIPGFAAGGHIRPMASHSKLRIGNDAVAKAMRREGGNSVLATLTPGEVVLSVAQAQRYKALGLDNIVGFKTGGNVGGGPTIRPVVNTSNVGGTSNVSVPITINGSGGGSEEEDAKLAKKLKGPIEGLVRGILNRESRFGGSM